jgi:rhamnosyltransferase subunit B
MRSTAPHYLIASVGSTGDIHPYLSLARALQGMGRGVTFVSHAAHEETVRRAGVPFAGVGTLQDYQRIVQDPDLLHPKRSFRAVFRDYARDMEGYVSAALAVPVDVIIASPLALPVADVVRAHRPHVRVVGAHLAPSSLRTCHDPLVMGNLPIPRWLPMAARRALWRWVDRRYIDPVPVAEINRLRAAHGLPPIRHFIGHMQQTPDLTLTLFPHWFGPPPPDWPQPLLTGDFPLYDPALDNALSNALQSFLQSGDAPVVALAGSSNTHAAHLFHAAAQAVQTSGRRAVFLTPYRAQLPPTLPPSIHHEPYAPLRALLPHAAAMVHHGGIGTLAEGLRAAVPQLITPFAWDQFDNAARACALGVARTLKPVRVTPRSIALALDALSAPELQTRCAEVAERLAQPHDAVALCRAMEQRLGVRG